MSSKKISAPERGNVEAAIDAFLEDPSGFTSKIESDLRKIGIEPSIDAVLSMFFGVLLGLSSATQKESELRGHMEALLPLLERRGWEMRQAIIKDRAK